MYGTKLFLGLSLCAAIVGCRGYRIGDRANGGEPTVVPFERGCEGLRSDPITIEGVELRDRTLSIHYAHSTGCAEHRYRVCGAERILRTDPGLWTVTVVHTGDGEECDAERLGVLQAEVPRGRDLVGLESLEGRNFTIVVE